jgi:hypothetical protein
LLDNMTLQQRLFCSKHTAGMCGVGKFQKIWKMREMDACPHCGYQETATHVWKCQADSVSDIWCNSIKNLQKRLQKIDTDTDTDLVQCIISYLNAWRYGHLLTSIDQEHLKELLALQDTIGAQQFFEGWIHKQRELTQNRYYQKINSRRSGKWWTIALITKLWEVAWDLWDFCNTVFHQQQNRSRDEDISILDCEIRHPSHRLHMTGLLPKDQHLLSISLSRLLSFPRLQKVEWIQQVELAVAQARARHYQLWRARLKHHRRN